MAVALAALLQAACTAPSRAPVVDAYETTADGIAPQLLYDLLLANIAGQRGQNDIALEAIMHAAESTDDARVAKAAVELAARLDRPQQVLALAELALARSPDDLRIQLLRADALLRDGRGDAALTQLRKILAADADNDEARWIIAELEIERDNLPAAIEMLRAIDSPDFYPDAQTRLAALYAERDGVDAGIAHLQTIKPRDDEDVIYLWLEQYTLYRKFDRDAQAKQTIDRALQQFPDNVQLRYHRGLFAAELGLLELHEQDMRAVIAKQPDNAHAYNALGYTLAENNLRLDEALMLIDAALALEPEDPFILDSMGWVYFRLGDTKRALMYLRRAIALADDAEIAAHLGEVLWSKGQKREAREIWRRGQQWAPDNRTLTNTMKRLLGEAKLSGAQ